jgi:exopolysaccharide biosynthesis WecB/TagA/CpsF family protein
MNIHRPPPQPRTIDILGVEVAELGREEATQLIARRIAADEFTRAGFLNAYISNVAASDQRLREALDEFLVLADGIGVDIAARAIHGRRFPENLNGTDFVPGLVAALRGRLRVGLVGASRKNIEGAAAVLRKLAPQHEIVVVSDGYFSPADEPRVLADLAALRPDLLIVAMGVPRQELWIARLDERHCRVAIAVGALFDFLSGAVPRAPQWMRSARLEWLFRLWIEPGRLWRRYIVGNPLFLARVARAKLSTRRIRP